MSLEALNRNERRAKENDNLFSIRTTKYNVRNLEMKLNLPKPLQVLATVRPHNGTAYPTIYVQSNQLDL